MFPSFVLIVHIIVCLALILIILLQSGKGAEMGAAFGGSSQTLFGSPGAAGFLTKITTVAAVVFMLTSLLLAFWSIPQRVKLTPTRQPVSEERAPAKGETIPARTPE
ncbi:MAG: preprotein translocase subunit SecG [Deltaproteobacteria bacterium]|nr:preprotein translocase subunit SecG [Deltaproteobacteria bacterium]